MCCARVYVYIHVYIYIHIHLHIYIYIYTHKHMQLCARKAVEWALTVGHSALARRSARRRGGRKSSTRKRFSTHAKVGSLFPQKGRFGYECSMDMDLWSCAFPKSDLFGNSS